MVRGHQPELARGGQVYYVYSRVNTIVEMTNTLAKLVPEANVAFCTRADEGA